MAVPSLPAITSTRRYVATNALTPTTIFQVPFPVFGDASDIVVRVDRVVQPTGWALRSLTQPIATGFQPFTDAYIEFSTAQTGLIEIIGRRQPRRVSQLPEAAGPTVRDINFEGSRTEATMRELRDDVDDLSERAILVPDGELGFELASEDDRASRFLAFDADGRPIYPIGDPTSVSVDDITDSGAFGRDWLQTATAADAWALIEAEAEFPDLPELAPAMPICTPLVYDMHWSGLRGVGYATGEPAGTPPGTGYLNLDPPIGVRTYSLLSGASLGATQVELTGASPIPVDGQLLVYLGTNGEYYSIVCNSVIGTTLFLYSPLKAAVAAGGNFFNFYINENHPNTMGYYALADDMVRSRLRPARQVWRESPVPRNTATVTLNPGNFHSNPGSVTVPAWTINPGAALSGAKWNRWRPEKTGRYVALFKVNRGFSAHDLFFNVLINGVFLYQELITTQDCVLHRVPFSVTDGDDVEFSLTRTDDDFNCSDLVIIEESGPAFAGFLPGQRWFVFGDSWAGSNTDYIPAQPPGILNRLRDRFPLTTFVNKGVGGNQMTHLIARYVTDIRNDIAANGPATGLIGPICGTNDFTASVTPQVFGRNLGRLLALIAEDNLIPIVWTAAVGSAPLAPTTRFDLSRRYTSEVPYFDAPNEGWKSFTPVIVGGSTAGAAGAYVLQKGLYRRIDGDFIEGVVNLQWTGHTGTGQMFVGNLPFANLSGFRWPAQFVWSGLTFSDGPPVGYVVTNQNTIGLWTAASGGALTILRIDPDNGDGQLDVSFRYRIGP